MLAVSMLSVGCGTIREHRDLVQAQNQTLTASVGSTLFHLNKKGDLPNVVGGRDIYGGKVDKGFAEVKLRAIHDDGVIDLLVYDVSRESAETTMDRYRPVGRVNVSQTVNVGAGEEGAIPVTVDTKIEKEYVVSGIKITFLAVRPFSVDYRITDLTR